MRIAIAGATGAVGREMLAVLARSRLDTSEVIALASERSVGRELPYGDGTVTVELLTPDAFAGVDVALFSCGGTLSRSLAPEAVSRGAVVIDNSSAFRMESGVPLVVPEINGETAAEHSGIIANPNCSTIILVLALAPLAREVGLEDVVVSTYQAVSGAGQAAIEELRSQNTDPEKAAGPKFPHRIADNVIPFVDSFRDGGYTREELKMVYETRKILGLPDLPVRATCVRVPVERAHSESVSVVTRQPITPDMARELFSAAPGLVLQDTPESHLYPMPLLASGVDEVGVGRIRQMPDNPRQLDFWISGDQLLKGAALNTVQIAEHLLVPQPSS